MRVLYVSDVLPADTTSGAKIIHRHLRLLASHETVSSAHWELASVPGVRSFTLPVRPLFARGLRSRRRRHVEALDGIFGIRVADADLRNLVAEVRPDLIVTVAQGGLCQNARRVAAADGLPLISFFHDWSPDWRMHPAWSRPFLERAFRGLYDRSTAVLCISDGIRQELGRHAHAEILPPIPEPDPSRETLPPITPDAPLLYAGVLNGLWQEEIRALGEFALAHKDGKVPLRLQGPNPCWGDSLEARLLKDGVYGGLLQGRDFSQALASARFLLVAMPFSPASRRFAECSFPSKLTEYCAIGRPIVIWSPPFSTAARWAAETKAALCVTENDPTALFRAVESLADDEARQQELIRNSQREYRQHFNPALLQQQFEACLSAALPGEEHRN